MDVKQQKNATLKNILKNLKDLKQRGDLSKIKAKRDEYSRLLKNEETSSLDRLNVLVSKITKESSPPQNTSNSEMTSTKLVDEIQQHENSFERSEANLLNNCDDFLDLNMGKKLFFFSLNHTLRNII
jgi:hypothetical protein